MATLNSTISPDGEAGGDRVSGHFGESPVQQFLPGLEPERAGSLAPPESVPLPGGPAWQDTAAQNDSGRVLAQRIGWYLLGVLCGCIILYLIDMAVAPSTL